ncbi:hypothetical protein ABW19_dt0207258 [Dactylella cylindrospora]|nr:hypothetical protein ABW19_dt0207258 [Dactylella cylindrospora]
MTSLNDSSNVDPTVDSKTNDELLNSAAPSYIDFDIFLASDFSPYSFANTLIHATNNPSDTTLDLSTPLSRVLFDLQEIDTHIHTLTTSNAETLLIHAKHSRDNSKLLVESIREQLSQLSASYARLSREVLDRHDVAKPLNTVVENLARTTRLLRGCSRCLLLGRQLEIQLAEAIPSGMDDSRGPRRPKKEDPKALIRAAHTIVELRRMYSNATGEAPGLETLDVMKTLLNTVITPADRNIKARAQQTIKEFSFSSSPSSSTSTTSSTADKEPTTSETRARATAAILVLHILSPTSYTPSATTSAANAKPPMSLLTTTITSYLQSQHTASLASLSRSLTTLSTLDRTLTEVSTRAANIVALEKILQSIPANISSNPALLPIPKPQSSLLDPSSSAISDSDSDDGEGGGKTEEEEETLLTPLLISLDTPSLTTHFFRTLASNLDPRVREIMSRGGLAAKNLRDSRDRVRSGLRDCVIRGVNAGTSAAGSAGGATAADGKGLEGLVGMMFGAVASLGR